MYILTAKKIVHSSDNKDDIKALKESLERMKPEVSYEVSEIKDGTPLDVWDVINEQITRTTINRYNWKELIGMTLTKKASTMYAEGKSADEAIKIVSKQLQARGIKEPKIFENLKIGISARYGEIKSEQNTILESNGMEKY
jgi:hypothetical protein